jgi:hypothetical protein
MLTAFPPLDREGPDRHGRLEDTGRDALGMRPEYKHRTSPIRAPTPSARLVSWHLLTNGNERQVLSQAVERIIREPDDPEPSAEIPLGLYLVRGDNVCSIGLVDEKLDESINWADVKGSAIGGIKHV